MTGRDMIRTVFLFPGQGAQHAGMGKEFYDAYPQSRALFERASELAGYSMEGLCFTENARLHETQYTQAALLTTCLAILEAVRAEGIRADAAAGLSLGEYCALTAAGAFRFEDALRIVCKRGIYMQEAVPAGQGMMCAVLSRRPLPVEEICGEVPGTVTVANYNCPGQQVISGETEAVQEAARRLLEAGAARTVPLNVSGPFHSPMLRTAGEKLRDVLEQFPPGAPELAFVSNVTAGRESDPGRLKELLARQVCSPVRWQQSMEYLISEGADTFIEIGPGRTLCGFLKKIDRTVRAFSVETPEDLTRLKEALPAAGQ